MSSFMEWHSAPDIEGWWGPYTPPDLPAWGRALEQAGEWTLTHSPDFPSLVLP